VVVVQRRVKALVPSHRLDLHRGCLVADGRGDGGVAQAVGGLPVPDNPRPIPSPFYPLTFLSSQP